MLVLAKRGLHRRRCRCERVPHPDQPFECEKFRVFLLIPFPVFLFARICVVCMISARAVSVGKRAACVCAGTSNPIHINSNPIRIDTTCAPQSLLSLCWSPASLLPVRTVVLDSNSCEECSVAVFDGIALWDTSENLS